MWLNQAGIALPAELKRRILFTLAMLAVYRIGVHVPTPGVDGAAVMSFFQAQSGGIFGLFNTFTGGALERFSIFALGIMPYISASIIFQLLQAGVPYLEQLKKEGEQGRRKLISTLDMPLWFGGDSRLRHGELACELFESGRVLRW